MINTPNSVGIWGSNGSFLEGCVNVPGDIKQITYRSFKRFPDLLITIVASHLEP